MPIQFDIVGGDRFTSGEIHPCNLTPFHVDSGSQPLKIVSNVVNDTLQRCNYSTPIDMDGRRTARSTRGQTVGGTASSTHSCNNVDHIECCIGDNRAGVGSLRRPTPDDAGCAISEAISNEEKGMIIQFDHEHYICIWETMKP